MTSRTRPESQTRPHSRTRPAFWHRLRLAERALVAYAAVIGVTAVVRAVTVPGNIGIATGHALIIALVCLASAPGARRWVQVLRELLPLLLLPVLYASLDVLNAGGRPVYDDVVLRWEAAIFGGQPSQSWWQSYPSRFWSTVLHGVYLLYYPLVAVPALALAWLRDWDALRDFVRGVVVTFCVCYLVFVFFPVAGPYYQFRLPTGPFVETPTARFVYASLVGGSSYGAAFPSSHVAATFAAGLATWRRRPALGAALALPVLLMPIATVYCQMHYAVDAIAGVMVGLAIPWAAARLDMGSRESMHHTTRR